MALLRVGTEASGLLNAAQAQHLDNALMFPARNLLTAAPVETRAPQARSVAMAPALSMISTTVVHVGRVALQVRPAVASGVNSLELRVTYFSSRSRQMLRTVEPVETLVQLREGAAAVYVALTSSQTVAMNNALSATVIIVVDVAECVLAAKPAVAKPASILMAITTTVAAVASLPAMEVTFTTAAAVVEAASIYTSTHHKLIFRDNRQTTAVSMDIVALPTALVAGVSIS